MSRPQNGGLDETDQQLLTLLRDDSRQTIAQLSKALSVSRGAVYARLAKLETDDIIAGYTVRLGQSFSSSRVRAHMMIKTLPRYHREVEQALNKINQVQAIYAISGEYDIIAVLEADDNAGINDLIDDIGLLEGVELTVTSVILATKLER